MLFSIDNVRITDVGNLDSLNVFVIIAIVFSVIFFVLLTKITDECNTWMHFLLGLCCALHWAGFSVMNIIQLHVFVFANSDISWDLTGLVMVDIYSVCLPNADE